MTGMKRLYGCMVTKIHAIFISSFTSYWRGAKIFVTFLLTFTLFRVANKLSKNWEYSLMKTLWNRLNKTAESQQRNKDVVWKMNNGLITRSLKHDCHRNAMDAATPTQKSAAYADLSVLAWMRDEQRVWTSTQWTLLHALRNSEQASSAACKPTRTATFRFMCHRFCG